MIQNCELRPAERLQLVDIRKVPILGRLRAFLFCSFLFFLINLFFCGRVFAYEGEIGEVVDSGNVVVVSDSGTVQALSEVAEILADIQQAALFNVNSNQVQYFRTYLVRRPFCDYVVTWDGDNDYCMYYGYGAFDSAEYVRIYRTRPTATGSYVYNITTGKGLVPSSNVYIDTREGDNGFVEIEQLKMVTLVCVSLLVLIAFWLLGKILFR